VLLQVDTVDPFPSKLAPPRRVDIMLPPSETVVLFTVHCNSTEHKQASTQAMKQRNSAPLKQGCACMQSCLHPLYCGTSLCVVPAVHFTA
jgi:hypothetical protein